MLNVSRQAIYDRIDAGTLELCKKTRVGRRNPEDLISLGELTKFDIMLKENATPRILELFRAS